MNPAIWMRAQLAKLHAIEDTPHAISFGFAIGVFFGFVPLFGIKTLLSVLVAWLCRTNKIAAFVGVTLHDVLLPFTPFLLRLEFQIGFWLLSHPHHFAPKMRLQHSRLHEMLSWTNMLKTGGPLLLGAVVTGALFAPIGYFTMRGAVTAFRARKAAKSDVPVSLP